MAVTRNMFAGLVAGAVAAIIAVLVSLPLESPDDIRLNSATVGFAALFVGVISGTLWQISRSVSESNRRYWWFSAGFGIVILLIAALAQMQLDNALVFTVPLALVVAICSIFLTPVFATGTKYGNWASVAIIVIAVVLSIVLAGQGDQESGTLTLPPVP